MEKPADYVELSDAEQDKLAISISLAAHECARFFVSRAAAPDLAQDVILFCLRRLRAGEWTALRKPLVMPLVLAVLQRRAPDLLRGRRRRLARDHKYAVRLKRITPTWMSPELVLEERDLAALHQEMLDDIPLAYREAYELVQTQDATYEEVAQRLGLSRLTVTSYVTRARRLFREQLSFYGIEAPKQRRTKMDTQVMDLVPEFSDDTPRFHGAE